MGGSVAGESEEFCGSADELLLELLGAAPGESLPEVLEELAESEALDGFEEFVSSEKLKWLKNKKRKKMTRKIRRIWFIRQLHSGGGYG